MQCVATLVSTKLSSRLVDRSATEIRQWRRGSGKPHDSGR